ncbi:DUF5110 domain-containing protein [Paludibacter sp. 221]|uniref:glycoside hydrolase family 31 protein n=1 Tax=Paludibacter sp. 221 TaxID=2302939 RepID=UPI0013D5017C|nr:glycoside hydrolase family 31 protein [Paludibacter sp. 221]NDV47400.1 DUF5110 domain-containing protein [Paludibacter sp. 221]
MKKHIAFILFVLITSIAFAENTNPVVIGNARFTFITPNLVRLEYVQNADFVNNPTLFAQERSSFDFIDIKTEETKKNHYTITTPLMRLEYYDDGFPFGQMNLRIYFQHEGKEKMWYMASTQRRNLRGTIPTLDAVGAPVPLSEGLLSRDGWYAIHDTGKEILVDGWVQPRAKEHLQDVYLFVYGNDYKSALKSLKKISGSVPMTRKYVHGSWYCRWWDYTADEYMQLIKEYKEHDFPIDILVFDMGWHTQKEATTGTGHAGNRGWTGYSWNKKLIPNPQKLINDLKKDRIYVVLNEHPHDGIRAHEDSYSGFMNAMGTDTTGRKEILFDAGSRKYMDNFMEYAHKESDDMGVAFWWLDWQQDYIYPLVRGTNMQHLPWLNHIYYNYSAQGNLRGAGFSRWGGWGDHRHPIQFSGDAVGNWDMLKFEIEMTSTSGNVGCFFWAHDIGGFYGGNDSELYTRWTQFGLLNSSLRIHSVYDPKLDRRPWLWGEEAEKAMRDIYHLRSRIMPYIYSSVWQCHSEMLPLNRAMYIEYPDVEEAYQHPQQFLFGDLLIGAPITTAGEGEDKTASQQVWLPEGDIWYNFFTGKAEEGGKVITETCDLNTFPLYIKGGYPFPMQPYTPRMASTPLAELIVRCYPGKEGDSNVYTLYEDDGLTRDYEKGHNATTRMEYKIQSSLTEITVYPAAGSFEGQLKKRAYTFELPQQPNLPSHVIINGKKVKTVQRQDLNGFSVTTKPMDIRDKIVLQF